MLKYCIRSRELTLYPLKVSGKMILLFHRWDMLVPWRVNLTSQICKCSSNSPWTQCCFHSWSNIHGGHGSVKARSGDAYHGAIAETDFHRYPKVYNAYVPGTHLSFVLPPKEGIFQLKQGTFGFQVYITPPVRDTQAKS